MQIMENFIVFEGLDGSGTSTQLSLLGEKLRTMGMDVFLDVEPTPGPVGRLVRQGLSGQTVMDAGTMAHLFAADRHEHVYGKGGIMERCRNGSLLFCDRYLFSSLAYQGLSCDRELPYRLNEGFPLPELLLYFEIDSQKSFARLSGREELEIFETDEFQKKLVAEYDYVLSTFAGSPMKIVRIDASREIAGVEKAVWDAIKPVLDRLDCR